MKKEQREEDSDNESVASVKSEDDKSETDAVVSDKGKSSPLF